MGHIWTTLALFVVCFVARALARSAYPCYSFEGTDDGWSHESGFYWKWSGSAKPDDSDIPSFLPTSEYLWFQDQNTPPVSGSIRSPDTFTLNYGDTVQATIYRHIIVGQENDTDRPVLRFVSNDGNVQNVLYNYNYEYWTPISVTCTNSDSWEAKTAACCKLYPCTGYFRVDGQVLIRDELLGIDDIGINGACGYGPTPTTPPPPPPPTSPPTTPPPTPTNGCCNFQTDLCNWSPQTISNGWIYSSKTPDSEIETITPYEYIYIVNTAAAATSPLITYVTDTATFTIEYFFRSTLIDSYDSLVASFTTSTGIKTYTSGPLPVTGYTFVPLTLTAYYLCGGASSCSGTFALTTSDAPSVSQKAALQYFSVNSVPC